MLDIALDTNGLLFFSGTRLVRIIFLSGQIGREVLDAAGRAVRVGATTDEIDRVVRFVFFWPLTFHASG